MKKPKGVRAKGGVEESVSTLLYSTIDDGGVRYTVGEALVHYLKEGGSLPTEEIESRLSFLFPNGYRVTFYLRGSAESVSLGEYSGGEEYIFTYFFLGERLDVIIEVGGEVS
ncbi:MAG: hypothetical protein J7L88_03255 [Thermoplasmata archaeon]|nr:hypothetical protein [Thermoplasmata archaeon]